ncbi:putative predicted protein [Rhizobium favelukesii]|uniref:Uncharacterized protein n=1 Tax=Rhizobium favelukesii TaxID=348824 RepID=W6RFF5_9HYPH|nr:putative predicted protein [Rhizobium favelukesii]
MHYGATPVLKGIGISLSKGKTLALLARRRRGRLPAICRSGL